MGNNYSEDLNEISSMKLIAMLDKIGYLMQEVYEKFYKKFKLSKTQFIALYRVYLAGEDGITLSVLGEQMFVTRSNITSLVDRMVARGLITRSINENDRRSIKAVITSEGREILENVLPNNRALSCEVLNFLTAEEKAVFCDLLLRFQNFLVKNYIND